MKYINFVGGVTAGSVIPPMLPPTRRGVVP